MRVGVQSYVIALELPAGASHSSSKVYPKE